MKPLPRVTLPTVLVLRCAYEFSSEGLWGLEISKLTGLKTGTVYPILDRLETLGWLSSGWEISDARSGPRRRVYMLTEDAQIELTTLFKNGVNTDNLAAWTVALKGSQVV